MHFLFYTNLYLVANKHKHGLMHKIEEIDKLIKELDSNNSEYDEYKVW